MSLLFFFFFPLLCNLRSHLSRTCQDYGTEAIKYTSKNALWLKLCLLIVLLSTVERFIDLKQTLSVWESFIRLQSDQIRRCGDDAGHFKWGPASLATAFLCKRRWFQPNFWPPQTDVTLQHLPTQTQRTTQLDVAQIVLRCYSLSRRNQVEILFYYDAPWSCQRLVKPRSAVYSSCNLISV